MVIFYPVQFKFSILMEISNIYSRNLCSSNLDALTSSMDQSQHSIIGWLQYNLEIIGVTFLRESIIME